MDGADLVALQKNRYWLRADGLSLDVGPFVAALEYATRREAVVVGKPTRSFFAVVLGELGVEPGGAAMVGDDVESDVGGALRRDWPVSWCERGSIATTPERLRGPTYRDAGLDRRAAGPPGSALVGPHELG